MMTCYATLSSSVKVYRDGKEIPTTAEQMWNNLQAGDVISYNIVTKTGHIPNASTGGWVNDSDKVKIEFKTKNWGLWDRLYEEVVSDAPSDVQAMSVDSQRAYYIETTTERWLEPQAQNQAYKTIWASEVTTDRQGKFSGSFVLPYSLEDQSIFLNIIYGYSAESRAGMASKRKTALEELSLEIAFLVLDIYLTKGMAKWAQGTRVLFPTYGIRAGQLLGWGVASGLLIGEIAYMSRRSAEYHAKLGTFAGLNDEGCYFTDESFPLVDTYMFVQENSLQIINEEGELDLDKLLQKNKELVGLGVLGVAIFGIGFISFIFSGGDE